MQSSIAALNAWLTTESVERSQIPAYGLRTPTIFEFCATHTEMSKTKGRLVLIGSTIFDDPAEVAFSMRDGYFPADAHLGVSRQESIFGLKDASKLEGTIVHWAAVGAQYQDDGNRASVERWWTLYCQQQGCTLASCDSSVATVFERVKNSTSAPIQRVTPDAGGKLEMRHAPIRIRVPAPVQESSISSEQPSNKAALAQRPGSAVQSAAGPDLGFMFRQDVESQPLSGAIVENCKIGIRWAGERDLDLYVRPTPFADELFYNHNRSREGIHLKDWLTSPDVDNNGFETVELRGRVDLSQLTLGVNFYAGATSAGGVDGTVRIEADGKVFQAPFHVRAAFGNRGADRSVNARARSAYWVVLDPLAITNQR
jgi:hypothetical protein